MAGATNSEDEESSLENIVAIAIGANHMTALRLDGKVYSWGTDMLGQLGDGRNGYEYEKVDLPVLTGTAASNSLIMDHVKVVSADTNEIAGEYEDAGKSGKSIEGRVSFNQMMEDIKSGKDEVS